MEALADDYKAGRRAPPWLENRGCDLRLDDVEERVRRLRGGAPAVRQKLAEGKYVAPRARFGRAG